MKILMTGAGGFVGSHLYNNMKKTHDITRIFSSTQSSGKQNTFSVDLTKRIEVETLIQNLSSIKFDAVIHLASKMASTDRIEDMSIIKKNFGMIENLVFLIKKLNPKVVIHSSTMALYPNISGTFSEDSLPRPQENSDCLYGLSKFVSEVILDFLLRNEDLRIVHLRIAQVCGKGMRGDRIVPVMIKELKENNTITLFGDGKRESNFIEINKLVEVIEFFLKNEASGVYNVGDQNLSYYDLAKIVVNKYGNDKSTIIKKHHGNKEKFKLDLSKIEDFVKNQHEH